MTSPKLFAGASGYAYKEWCGSFYLDKIKAEERMEASMADDALKDLEVELGMRAPETTPVQQAQKDLGPAEAEAARKELENLEKS